MTEAGGGQAVEILLVEDNPGDVGLAREGLRECKIRNNLHVVGDGLEAAAFLHRKGAYASRPRPDIILLDLNLPKRDGRDLLREIRRTTSSSGSPSSSSPRPRPRKTSSGAIRPTPTVT